MLRHNFCRSDSRLKKFLLLITLLDESPLTSIYFATFEKKTEVWSPVPTQPKFLVFGKYTIHDTITLYNIHCSIHYTVYNIHYKLYNIHYTLYSI